jgi:proton-translocating NAD(P)+ transhydrogenase subunit alpha
MIVGVPLESNSEERRVPLVPAVVPGLTKLGIKVLVERGAGENAGFDDVLYQEQGAAIVSDRQELFSESQVLVRVRGFGEDHSDFKLFRPGHVVVGLLDPFGNLESVRELAESGVTVFSLELLPRISRAQSMDALSSMATIAGYKAVLLAANSLQKMFPLMMTAAGTITPARVFVIGAGVAGLQAIATSRRLGAVVQAYDVRPAVKEQVESLGASFVELGLETKEAEASGGYAKAMDEDFYRKQRDMMAKMLADSDVVITTAAIPGKKAPILITEEMVRGMRNGSVIVDLASETGGNCELTRPGETINVNGVVILGSINLPSSVPFHASQMYARNIAAFLQLLVKDGAFHLVLEDQIIRETLVTHNKEVVHPRLRELLGFASAAS